MLEKHRIKILCCGSMDWNDYQTILDTLSQYSKDTIIIEGEARGADLLSSLAAEKLGMLIIRVPAEWGIHGKMAGLIRNIKMLDMLNKEDIVIAFWDGKSKGTGHCIREAQKRNIQVIIKKLK